VSLQLRASASVGQSSVAMTEARRQCGNQEDRGRPTLEVVIRGLVTTVTEDTSVSVTVICKVNSRDVC
jgi:hypothetical protein